MIVSNTRRTAKPTPTPGIVGDRPALGYMRLYRLALVRNELLMNIAAASRPSLAGAR